MAEKKERVLPPHKLEIPCRLNTLQFETITPGKPPHYYDALPRDCKFAYKTPGYYATGFRILDVYKTEVDFTEMKRLLFLEDPKLVHKWGLLKSRVPYPETRVTDLPGTRELNYHNYCLRSLTPESSMSWRKSIKKPLNYSEDTPCEEEDEPTTECVCKD